MSTKVNYLMHARRALNECIHLTNNYLDYNEHVHFTLFDYVTKVASYGFERLDLIMYFARVVSADDGLLL